MQETIYLSVGFILPIYCKMRIQRILSAKEQALTLPVLRPARAGEPRQAIMHTRRQAFPHQSGLKMAVGRSSVSSLRINSMESCPT